MKKIDVLRKKYPFFVYKNYSWKFLNGSLKISFDFETKPSIYPVRKNGKGLIGFKIPPEFSNGVNFKPEITIENVNPELVERLGKSVLNNLVFNLGLIEVLSYWKATCSPEILIEAGFLNKEQIKWWKDLIMNGMGQFFYENKIDFTQPNFIKILSKKEEKKTPYSEILKDRILLSVGGGKDSIVTLEILSSFAFKGSGRTKSSFAKASADKKEIKCFSLNPTENAKQIINVSGCKNPILVKREINPKLLELNRQGFLNGHTPISAYFAFLSVLTAVLFDYKYIAFSNERSSNEGNLKYLGKTINHQYSKRFDFEKKFRNYSKRYLARNVEYFSFLRPLYEIQIAKLFSRYPKYFKAFLSCNEAYKTYSGTKKPTKKWCGNCSKCLFAFAVLYPFIGEKIVKVFGRNLFENKGLLPIMQELIGERRFKPFECVGTKKESLVAFYLSLRNFKQKGGSKLPFLLNYFEREILPKYPSLEKESKKIMSSFDKKHNLPPHLMNILLSAIK